MVSLSGGPAARSTEFGLLDSVSDQHEKSSLPSPNRGRVVLRYRLDRRPPWASCDNRRHENAVRRHASAASTVLSQPTSPADQADRILGHLPTWFVGDREYTRRRTTRSPRYSGDRKSLFRRELSQVTFPPAQSESSEVRKKKFPQVFPSWSVRDWSRNSPHRCPHSRGSQRAGLRAGCLETAFTSKNLIFQSLRVTHTASSVAVLLLLARMIHGGWFKRAQRVGGSSQAEPSCGNSLRLCGRKPSARRPTSDAACSTHPTSLVNYPGWRLAGKKWAGKANLSGHSANYAWIAARTATWQAEAC